jgi:hypothetical protein
VCRYLALLACGLQPARWCAAVGIAPVADYAAAHALCSPAVQQWDRAFMGGPPDARPELYAARSPHTYLPRMAAPQLLLCGRHDVYCPTPPVLAYGDAARARGLRVEVHVLEGGHCAGGPHAELQQLRLARAFLRDVVPPTAPHSALAVPLPVCRAPCAPAAAMLPPPPPPSPPRARTREEADADCALDAILARAAACEPPPLDVPPPLSAPRPVSVGGLEMSSLTAALLFGPPDVHTHDPAALRARLQ